MNYAQLQTKHQQEHSDLEGIFFAFNDEQFKEGMKKVGLDMDLTDKAALKGSVASIGAGGYIRKERVDAYIEMLERHQQENKQLRKDSAKLFDALVYELSNHEYGYTHDPYPALEAVGVEASELPSGMLDRAKRKALQDAVSV